MVIDGYRIGRLSGFPARESVVAARKTIDQDLIDQGADCIPHSRTKMRYG